MPGSRRSRIDVDDYSAWIGRTEERDDLLDPARSNVLLAAIGGRPALNRGDRLPPLHHWLHFWDARTPEETGRDGHPKRGGFLPPIALPRRMWAGGRFEFHAPLLLGEPVRRISTIRTIERKHGRSGELVFVTVGHELHGSNGLAITEEQDLVYRAAATASQASEPVGPDGAAGIESCDPDPVLLFRYSALTMNSHRIHYDQPYATAEEGYAGLVVQGPLQASLLARLGERLIGRPLASFHFRGLAPAIAGHRLDLHGEAGDSGFNLWVEQGGRRTMSAHAS
jgi:3-methylfumaryl-CoA hydratase